MWGDYSIWLQTRDLRVARSAAVSLRVFQTHLHSSCFHQSGYRNTQIHFCEFPCLQSFSFSFKAPNYAVRWSWQPFDVKITLVHRVESFAANAYSCLFRTWEFSFAIKPKNNRKFARAKATAYAANESTHSIRESPGHPRVTNAFQSCFCNWCVPVGNRSNLRSGRILASLS